MRFQPVLKNALPRITQRPLKQAFWGSRSLTEGVLRWLLNLDSMSWPGDLVLSEHSLTLKAKGLTCPKGHCLS